MLTIRPVAPDDLDRLLEINEANVPDVGPIDLDRLQYLVGESEIALVAHVAGSTGPTIIGFCLVLAPGSSYDSVNYRWFMDRFSDAYYLDRVAFDATFQGQGHGSALYAAVDREIEQRRANGTDVGRLTLEVNVEPPNEQSLGFHARRDFTEVGRQATPYGIEVSLMEKRY